MSLLMLVLLLLLMLLLLSMLLYYYMYTNMFVLCLSLMILFVWMILNMVYNNNITTYNLMNLILLSIIIFLNCNSLWKLYVIYELAMLPMLIMILSFGVNPNRIPASLYMFMYMIMFSFPSLMIMIMNYNLFNSNLNIVNLWLMIMNKFIISLMFLVKMPMFLLHYWLPKAHVEASTLGSMILASGLLKMGSYGYYKIMKFLNFSLSYYIILILTSLVTLLCLFQSDLKKLIALMSVSHMNLCLASLLTLNEMGYMGFILMNLTHTLISGVMFYLSGILISFSSSRMMFLNSMFTYSKFFILYVMVFLMNLSTPPFFSFFMEVVNLSILFFKNFISLLLIMIIGVISSLYTLMILNSFKILKNKSLSLTTSMSIIFFIYITMFLWFIM